MDMKWIDKLARIFGVTSALLVDHDGLVIAESGNADDAVAPHSALMVKKLIDSVGLETVSDWIWTQCETDTLVIGIANVDVGILVILMEPDANLGLVRLEARNIRRNLQSEFSASLFPGNKS